MIIYFKHTINRSNFYIDIFYNTHCYLYILYFTFLFSLVVFVSAAGQYNVIWTGTGLPRFRFGSGTVPALLFQIKSIIQQIVHVTSGHMAVYGPVCHQNNIIWTEASICYIYSPLPGIDDNRRIWLSYLSPLCLLLPETFKLFGFILRVPDEGYPRNASYVQYLIAYRYM